MRDFARAPCGARATIASPSPGSMGGGSVAGAPATERKKFRGESLMQKKLMVVAVASALGTIGTTAAYAQGSSVQIYGTIATALEGAQAKGADTSVSGQSSLRGLSAGTPFNTVGSAYTATPAQRDFRMRVISSGSNFGIRGREDLGSGLYAGFQAEAAITLGGTSAQTSGTGGTVATWR